MTRLQPVFRLILAAVSLLLSFQAPTFAAEAANGRTGTIQDGARKLIDGRDRPEEHAVLTAVSLSGNFATRNMSGGGSGSGLVSAAIGYPPVLMTATGIESLSSWLREYRLRNAHIVLAQFQALFPKHWFW